MQQRIVNEAKAAALRFALLYGIASQFYKSDLTVSQVHLPSSGVVLDVIQQIWMPAALADGVICKSSYDKLSAAANSITHVLDCK